jgi:hypothetical protein
LQGVRYKASVYAGFEGLDTTNRFTLQKLGDGAPSHTITPKPARSISLHDNTLAGSSKVCNHNTKSWITFRAPRNSEAVLNVVLTT